MIWTRSVQHAKDGKKVSLEFHVGQSVLVRSHQRWLCVAQEEDSANAPTGLSGVTNVGAGLFLSYGKRSSANAVCAPFVTHALHHAGIPLWGHLVATRENHAGCVQMLWV